MEPHIIPEHRQSIIARFAMLTRHTTISLLMIGAGLLIALVVVLLDGGTPSAYAHFAYAPTIIAAFRFRALGGLICGFLGGLVVGPFAAWLLSGLDTFVLEQYISWGVRTTWIAIVGFTLGALFTYVRKQSDVLDWYRHTDSGTGIPNLPGVRKQVTAMIADHNATSFGRQDLMVTALKITNYGHLVLTFGYEDLDAVIKDLGSRIRNGISERAVVGRTGTDELLIVDPIAIDTPAARHTRNIEEQLQTTLQLGDMQVYVDVVMGVARAPMTTNAPEKLFVQASAAACRARDSGMRMAFYNERQERHRKDGMHLLGEIPRALEAGEISLVYQPKLDLRSGKFVGVEALARWQHPQRGDISPALFVPLIENTGIIDAFTKFVLHAAITQSVQWQHDDDQPSIAVNMSTRNLTGDSLLQYVEDLLSRTGLPASALELEITETALVDMQDPHHLNLLAGLRDIGVRIAIDDFGTGYASLSYIRDLPVDILKLDKSFISSALTIPRERKMLKRMIQLAKDLDLEVVGEGIEDRQTLGLLNELGCDLAQGFYISRPLPASAVSAVLTRPWSSDEAGSLTPRPTDTTDTPPTRKTRRRQQSNVAAPERRR
ncbi:MAG: bifunctional diguanylate cyclase/phosphodiesterase [Aquisalimonadaceae bacterium]